MKKSGMNFATLSGSDRNNLMRSIHRDKAAFKTLMQETNALVSKTIQNDNLTKILESSKNILINSLRQSGLPINKMIKIQNRLRSIPIVNTSILLQQAGNDDSELSRVYEKYVDKCGVDGLLPHAFYYTPTSSSAYIVLCPGFLLLSKGIESTHTQGLESILFILSHELSHDFSENSRASISIHGNYLGCVKDVYAANSPLGRDRYVNERAGEITADFWAVQAAANYLKNIEPGKRASALRNMFGLLCETEDSGVHPSGRIRITRIMGMDPQINKIMGCTGSQKKIRYGCSLSGPVKLP